MNVLRRSSASVYYCQRKPKNRKNGVGLGTRLKEGGVLGCCEQTMHLHWRLVLELA